MQKKRVLPLIAAVIVVIALILYPTTQCSVTGADIVTSPPKAFVISLLEGYAVGFSFNLTNRSNCQISAQSMRIVLRGVTYSDGRQVTQESVETQSVTGIIDPSQTRSFSYTFNNYFTYRPAKLLLSIEMTFAGTEQLLIYDGEVPV
jgi:hypothetical protein